MACAATKLSGAEKIYGPGSHCWLQSAMGLDPTPDLLRNLHMFEPSHLKHPTIGFSSDAAGLEPHWGYADRVIPCKNDAGSCEYLDVVYHAHDLGMLYSGIIWATVGGMLFIWLLVRKSYVAKRHSDTLALDPHSESSRRPQSGVKRLASSMSSLSRRWLLPEISQPVFGHTTRLQVVIFAVLVSYLTIWSFVGIAYKRWITPVKNSTLYNTRTSLGPFADRVGLLAYALMPFMVMLSSRESILSLMTGIPYQHFNFLHRWLGYIIFAQSVVHTIGWIVIETVLYQPQPKTGRDWITQKYMVWGVVAQIFITFIFVSSLSPVIRLTGYEFFRKAHYVVAMLFIGACWAHWSNLACFMIASLTVWFIDRGVRFVRTALMHHNYLPNGKMGFASAKAQITHFPDEQNGDVVRLDFEHPQDAWSVGQHFYLCFPEISIWQSHPFTPASLPRPGGLQKHSYVIRSKKGETKHLARLAAAKNANFDNPKDKDIAVSSSSITPVILTGPYSENIMSSLDNQTNVLCIAGGTGVTYVLPILLSLVTQRPFSHDRRIEFIWAIRTKNDATWVQPELDVLEKSAKQIGLNIHIYVTRECCTVSATVSEGVVAAQVSKPRLVTESQEKDVISSSTASMSSGSESSSTRYSARPDLLRLTTSFIENTISGSTSVFASGPAGMISDIRTIVALNNNPGEVWRGQQRRDINLICDNRMEW